jgi:hypothetical protein
VEAFARANDFAPFASISVYYTQNWTIHNCPPGRAAKGASPATSTKFRVKSSDFYPIFVDWVELGRRFSHFFATFGVF